jgi:hypothetical protein
MNRFVRSGLAVLIVILLSTASVTIAAAQTSSGTTDPLIQVLVQKGVLSADDAKSIRGTPAEQRDQLLLLLKDKGVISAAEYTSVSGVSAPITQPAVVNTGMTMVAQKKQTAAPKPAEPAVIPAVAPVRVLQTEPSKPEGLIPDIKLGSGAKLKLYGFLKASAAYDTSQNNNSGFDFIIPATGSVDNGPDKNPDFHVKARFARLGANFEWPDPSSKIAVTGKLETDYEGDFTRVGNRNVSSVRSSQLSLRLAYGRVDYHASDKTSLFLLAGQDWSPFASSILPNDYETTFLGAYWGSVYEREPQIRVGMLHRFGGSRKFAIGPEFAVAFPAFGLLPTDLANQLAYGERQGADSVRPNIEGRVVFQFQADKAKGVPPAEIVISGMHGDRSAIVTGSAINAALSASSAAVKAAFLGTGTTFGVPGPAPGPFYSGTTVNTDRWGAAAGIGLPTRYVTFTANYYVGRDLRWYFGGQLFTPFNNLVRGGLLNAAGTAANATVFSVASIDGASTLACGLTANGLGSPVCAPQDAPRTRGGFVELGFPLSRLFHANPEGRGSNWTLNLHYGIDTVLARDALRAISNGIGNPGTGTRFASDQAFVNLGYKMNKFLTFAVEQTYYRTRFVRGTTAFPTVAGFQASQWKDSRSEFFTIFSF